MKRRLGVVKKSWRLDERLKVFCKPETLERRGHQEAAAVCGIRIVFVLGSLVAYSSYEKTHIYDTRT